MTHQNESTSASKNKKYPRWTWIFLQRWRERLHVRMSQAWFSVDDYLIARDVRGHDHIIGELRREKTGPRVGFIRIILSVRNICFRHDLLHLKGSYDAISSFPFSLECYKLFVHR